MSKATLLRLDAGKKIFVWGVNDKDDMIELIDMGVDGIETDHPDMLREVLQGYGFIRD